MDCPKCTKSVSILNDVCPHGKARVSFKAKDYLTAAHWQNAAERASLEIC